MEPAEFRDQLRRALGDRFHQFIQEGEIDAQDGHWLYRIAVAGSTKTVPILWYYYLAAAPDGRQVIFMFTLDAKLVEQFAARDRAIVSTLEFNSAMPEP